MIIEATIEFRRYSYAKEIDIVELALGVLSEHEDPTPDDLLDAIVDEIWMDVENGDIDLEDVEIDDIRVSKYGISNEALVNAYAEARIIASKPPFDPNQLTLGIS